MVIAGLTLGHIGYKKFKESHTTSGKSLYLAALGINIFALLLTISISFVYVTDQIIKKPSQDLLKNSIEFKGTLPKLSQVNYVTKTGAELVSSESYPGFIDFFVEPFTKKSDVEKAITNSGGKIAASIPDAGLYLIEVNPGQESNFISKISSESWFLDAIPSSPIYPAAITVYDFFSKSKEDKLKCGADHGDLTKLLTERLGSSSKGIDIKNDLDYKAGITVVKDIIEKMKEAKNKNENVVFSMSLQSAESSKASGLSSGCKEKSCDSVRHAQKLYLQKYFQMMEAQIKSDPTISNRAILVISAGNAGIDLDSEIKYLKEKFPNSFKQMKIVGSSTKKGEVDKGDNHLQNNNEANIIYSLGTGVNISDKAICSGTSFAAPEVSAVLDYIWSKNPKLNAKQIIESFDKVLKEKGKNNTIPQDENGHTTQEFLDAVLTSIKSTTPIIESTNVIPTDISPDEKYADADNPKINVPQELPAAGLGSEYNQKVSASGGTPPYAFFSSFSLHLGLEVTEDGTIKGVPYFANDIGKKEFEICVQDSKYNRDCANTTMELKIIEEKWTGTLTGTQNTGDYYCGGYGYDVNIKIDFTIPGDLAFSLKNFSYDSYTPKKGEGTAISTVTAGAKYQQGSRPELSCTLQGKTINTKAYVDVEQNYVGKAVGKGQLWIRSFKDYGSSFDQAGQFIKYTCPCSEGQGAGGYTKDIHLIPKSISENEISGTWTAQSGFAFDESSFTFTKVK